MAQLSFDTTFLIDLQREKTRSPGAANSFLQQHAGDVPCCSRIVMGEYAEGFPDPTAREVRLMLDSFEPLEITGAVVCAYARLSRHLRSSGTSIGANDTWIAACSLAFDLPLVTRNPRHFQRVPNLTILTHSSL